MNENDRLAAELAADAELVEQVRDATQLKGMWGSELAIFIHMQQAKRLLCFYRVQTRDNAITIMELGIGTGLASFDTLTYDCASSLPEWMQRKLAVLTTLPYDVPTEELENIGRRVSQHVFWVYPSAGETVDKLGGVQGGTNTRTKSKGRRKKAA